MPAPNRVILGLMNFGPSGISTVRVDSMDTFKQALDLFQARGYNEVDTARSYAAGKQEAWSAEAGLNERKLKVASKCHAQGANKFTELLDTSLAELKMNSIDIYYLHAADRDTPFADTLKVIDAAHKQGKFKELGISNFTAAEVAEICTICSYNNWVHPTVYQGAYNIVNRAAERDLVPVLRRFGIQWVVFNPIAGGLLAGKFKSSADVPTEGRFSDAIGPVGAAYRDKYFKDSTFEGLRLVDGAASKHNLTMIEVAYRWVTYHSAVKTPKVGGNDAILIGASSLEQLQSNLDNLEKGPLPEEVVQACEAAWDGIAGVAPQYYSGKYEYGYDTVGAIFGK